MKHIGIVACSTEGAALCCQSICRDALAIVGKNDHPCITLDSIAMARWLPAFDADAGHVRGETPPDTQADPPPLPPCSAP